MPTRSPIDRSHLHPKQDRPLVSVILPAYNAAAFLERTLQSVVAQTYEHFEVRVVDDGSQDDTAEIVRSFMAEDSRIYLHQQVNAGVAAARNQGIEIAQGDLIAPIDADDIWYPEYLAKLVDCLVRSAPKVGIVYAWSQDIDRQDRPTGGFHVAAITGNVYHTLLCHNFLGNASATMMWRHCLVRVGNYDSTMRQQQAQGCEDWDLYLRLAACYEFAVVPEFLVGYRKLADSMSGDGETMARSQALMLQQVQARSPEIPGWYYGLSRSSFYLYLAYQTMQPSPTQPRISSTQHWLNQAKQAHYWATLLRPSWHILSLKLIYAKLVPDRKSIQRPPVYHPPNRLPNRPPNRLQVWLKVWITQQLHGLLSMKQFRVASSSRQEF